MPPHNRTAPTESALRHRFTEVNTATGATGAAATTATLTTPTSTTKIAAPNHSSGVAFYPPSQKFWRIGNKWYDFTDFLDKHPGGKQALLLSRDRFEDATFVFESHHHEFLKARAIIRKYEISKETALAHGIGQRPARGTKNVVDGTHFDAALDQQKYPDLLDQTAFYSVMRTRVSKYLKSVGCRDGGPTTQCIVLFWAIFVLYLVAMYTTWSTGSFLVSAVSAIVGSWLGAFGHNWVHQPKYKLWGWAILSLDTLGFSSESWYREHNLQHHMYTNTPWDNHFIGTEPFLITNPTTAKRNWVQTNVLPYINPLILCFGVYGNYVAHTVELVKGNEEFSIGKVCLPLHFYIMMSRWGVVHGFLLTFLFHAIIGMYYFTLALMNHNAEHTHDVKGRNAAKDWGHAQLHSSADWGVNMSFLQAIVYLWLNYHTVHHLFPRTDFSHHPAIQKILIRTCKEHGIKYATGSFMSIYREMVTSFTTPRSLYETITVYGGGV